jgi:hypothetical protein
MVLLAGESGGPGHAVTLGLTEQVGGPGLGQLLVDGRVHRGLLGTSLALSRGCG